MSTLTCVGFLVFFECQMPAPKPPIVVCPPMPAWSREYQGQVADEMVKLPAGSALRRQIGEHIRLRDQIRKCRGR